ncbi:K(+)-transporting ATPase subunit F [Nocardia higoensis]|uniref:K(+)-transporting ATPase subunit F n=1 Tax=Nocardia higoensis TaxID=228599 RepID=A0ABS0DF65_9NOCA|nr:K(+)-transporting ATPase subunit F [Nocardia higoensis]MBF6357064.1 K(+)-transporting ATPase subunit F [Nocardia higoensis]
MTWAGVTSVALVLIGLGLVVYLLTALLDPERF